MNSFREEMESNTLIVCPTFQSGTCLMSITVEATYENGVLKPTKPLPLKEHDKVQITVHVQTGPIVQAYGIIGWAGDAETLEGLTRDHEFDPAEGP
jgi:predicted DNA-binding antitoxin AbrB/MazE fold protein